MQVTPPLPLLRRVPSGVWTALAWCAGLVLTFLMRIRLPGEGEPAHSPGALLFHWDGLSLLLVATALVVAGSIMLDRRPLPALTLLLAASAVACAPLGVGEIPLAQFLAVDAALYFIAATAPRPTSIAAIAMSLTMLAGYLGTRLLFGWVVGTSAELAVAMMAVIAWLVGRSVHQAHDHAESLRAQATAQAITSERLRIARELHDMVAHSIGIIALQAGAARRVIDTQPVRAREALGEIETVGRETLSGLRRMLGALRHPDPARPRETTPITHPEPARPRQSASSDHPARVGHRQSALSDQPAPTGQRPDAPTTRPTPVEARLGQRVRVEKGPGASPGGSTALEEGQAPSAMFFGQPGSGQVPSAAFLGQPGSGQVPSAMFLGQPESGPAPSMVPIDVGFAPAGLADLERLAATTTAAGVQVQVRWLGVRRSIPPEIDMSAYRIVQEAVTNVTRHAGHPSCQVTIDFGDEELAIEVLDPAPSPLPDLSPDPDLGLPESPAFGPSPAAGRDPRCGLSLSEPGIGSSGSLPSSCGSDVGSSGSRVGSSGLGLCSSGSGLGSGGSGVGSGGAGAGGMGVGFSGARAGAGAGGPGVGSGDAGPGSGGANLGSGGVGLGSSGSGPSPSGPILGSDGPILGFDGPNLSHRWGSGAGRGTGLGGGRGRGRKARVGYGLVGMRERVALLHGVFSAGPCEEGGFRVVARLPMQARVR
ncbi:histidine kinase [Nonomuraea sp. NPDC005650]|uniref:histidine kinase n=1 Tax=Nonomuraea sp. NPDC005650 TaxID=3157045 RepID=UPI0033A38F67